MKPTENDERYRSPSLYNAVPGTRMPKSVISHRYGMRVPLMENVPSDVSKILGPNEQVELYIKEKIYHPKMNIDSVVLTNQRIILRHPHAMGLKKDYTDFSYADVANAILDKGVVRSTVKCVLRFNGEPLHLRDLPNGDAERAYGIIRENIARFQSPLTVGPGPIAAVSYQAYQQQQTAAMGPSTGLGPICKKCGARSAQGARFCASCGQSF